MKRLIIWFFLLVCGWLQAATTTATYALTTETFQQVSTLEAIQEARVTQQTLTFKVDDPIWHYTYNESPIDFVGSTVSITSVTLPDVTTNTANLALVPSVTILDANGSEVVTSTTCTVGSETVRLASMNGTHVDVVLYTYAFDAITLETSQTYTLRLNTSSTTAPLLPVFRNASSEYTDADQSVVRIDGGDTNYSPYLQLKGEKTMKRFVYDVATAESVSLSELLTDSGFVSTTHDAADTMIIVRLKTAGATLKMDTSIAKAALIIATDTPATTWKQDDSGDWLTDQKAATVCFYDGYSFTGPIQFRDVKASQLNSTIKMIRLEYEADGEATPVIPSTVWAPSSFALACDLELAAYPDMSDDQSTWFGRNPLTIPSGESVRIVTHVDDDNFPNLAFADHTSRLALAIPSSDPHDLTHYRELIESSSGTTRFVSPINIPTSDAGMFVLGVDDDSTTPASIQTIESYNTVTFKESFYLGYGTGNSATFIQHVGDVTVGGEGLFLGVSDAAAAKYTLEEGTLTAPITLGRLVHDAVLTIGDGEGSTRSAIAEVASLRTKPDGTADADVTGTAQIVVNADGELRLTGDLSMTPALRRRMELNGGQLTVVGETADTCTYTFGTDLVNGGGLQVTNGGVIDASSVASLTIDAITGMEAGTLVFKGDVTLQQIGNFKGALDLEVDDTSSNVTVEALSGINSEILFGYLGANGTTGVDKVLEVAHKASSLYRGVIGFKVAAYPIVDVSTTDEIDLHCQLRVQNGQTLRIRLD